ncbi:PHP domain-containing protein [Herbiconiux sp. 11R-BC]|uniref:PHP domain-containing protein n=1 Tax=Herbiconiux sp. 11R-BC TaxID=3111637 RepID=UPI003C0BBD83
MNQLPPEWADPSVADESLSPRDLTRRGLLRGLGLLGIGVGFQVAGSATGMFGAGSAFAAASTGTAAAGSTTDDPALVYLVGDHHVHSVYSHDAKYSFSQLTKAAQDHGLDWLAFTEHSNWGHANAGGALDEHREILAARNENPRMLVFQGLEWYIPAAEHATVLVAPGPSEARLLRSFELAFDGKLLGYTEGSVGHPDTARNRAHALAALQWLAARKADGTIDDVIVLANHPARLGIDSPEEIRDWRDAAAGIMVGMEGAPGSQGAAIPGWRGSNSVRGEYENSPTAQTWPGFPSEAFVTYGGFDWMTATVGGMWDAMLSEGKGWWITSNSDVHRVVFDKWANGTMPAGLTFDTAGRLADPVLTDSPQPGSDFWPGQFSRTHVGVESLGYLEVMAALRTGRVWVDHGHLIDALDVRLIVDGQSTRGVTLGGRLTVTKGTPITLQVTITAATRPNFNGDVPKLANVDLIRGAVTGAAPDRTQWTAPDTRVVEHRDVSAKGGTFTLTFPITDVQSSFYLRLRGGDGKRTGTGLLGAQIDAYAPQAHPKGDGNPWVDLWFYANPIFVDVV